MSTKPKPVCQSLFPWLRDNGFTHLGGLTGQDYPALKTAVHAAELWCASDSDGRSCAAAAFNGAVRAMQPQFWNLPYHAIAHVGDWSHREELWHEAGLPPLANPGRCTYE